MTDTLTDLKVDHKYRTIIELSPNLTIIVPSKDQTLVSDLLKLKKSPLFQKEQV